MPVTVTKVAPDAPAPEAPKPGPQLTPSTNVVHSDRHGNITRPEAPRRIDPLGRPIAPKPASEAVSSSPPSSPPSNTESGSSASPEDETKLTDSEVRKEFLSAQRLKRQAIEMEKRAKASLEKAEAFEKAKALAESGEDPFALLRAAGLDEVKTYRAMTDYALSDKGKAQETDPVKRQMNEYQRQLDEYKSQLETQAKQIKTREELAMHQEAISTHVIPLLRDNSGQYESLLAHYGNQAAIAVHNRAWDIFQQTGQVVQYKEVADQLEKFWDEQILNGINIASKIEKFKVRFAQSSNPHTPNMPTHQTERTITPNDNRSVTLSNSTQQSSIETAFRAGRPSPETANMSRGEVLKMVLGKMGQR